MSINQTHNQLLGGPVFGRPTFFLDAVEATGAGGSDAGNADPGTGGDATEKPADTTPDPTELQAQLVRAQEIKAEIVSQRDQLKAEIRNLKAQLESSPGKNKNTSDDENVSEQLEKLRGENSQLQEALETFKQQESKYRTERAIEDAAKGRAFSVSQLKKLLAPNLVHKEIDGETRLVAVHDDGKVRYTAKGPMTAEELVEVVFSENPNLLASQYRGGTAGRNTHTGAVDTAEPQTLVELAAMPLDAQNRWLAAKPENKQKATQWAVNAKRGGG